MVPEIQSKMDVKFGFIFDELTSKSVSNNIKFNFYDWCMI